MVATGLRQIVLLDAEQRDVGLQMAAQRLTLQADLVAVAVDGIQVVAVVVLVGLRSEDGGVAGVGRGFRADVVGDAGVRRDLALVADGAAGGTLAVGGFVQLVAFRGSVRNFVCGA